jgi:hypothetical protein
VNVVRSFAPARSPRVLAPICLVGLRPWRVKRRREVPCRIRNCHHHRNRSRRDRPRQLHARWQIERRNRRSQSVIRHRPRLAAHRTMAHPRCAVPAFHFHRMMPAAARHAAFLRRAHLSARHQCQRHRQQRQDQTRSLYPPHDRHLSTLRLTHHSASYTLSPLQSDSRHPPRACL